MFPQRFFFSVCLVFLLIWKLFAVPIEPHWIWLTQPDGTRFQAKIFGDEYVVYYETVDGFTILQDSHSKNWQYAMLGSNGYLIPSSFRVTTQQLHLPDYIHKHLRNSRNIQREESLSTFFAQRRQVFLLPHPKKGIFRLAVLLIEFPDVRHTFPAADFEALLFSKDFTYQSPVVEEPAYGSLYDYFRENSNGQLLVQGQVFDWVVADNQKQYYEKSGNLIWEAIQKSGVNLGQFEGVAVIYAGNVEETGSKLWPETVFSGFEKPVYIMSEQWQPQYQFSPIGIHCHEFGHLLGLPDLYDTDFTSRGIDIWGLMGYGAYGNGHLERPFQMCAWSKQRLGWISDIPIYKASPQNFELPPVETSNMVGKAISSYSYFLLENRQNLGYDFFLPQNGLLIWHIDERFGYQNTDEHRLVDLVEADHSEKTSLAGDPFPGSTQNHFFTPTSWPSSIDYDGKGSLSIMDIHTSGQKIIFGASVDLGQEARVYVKSLDYSFPTIFTALEMSGSDDSIHIRSGLYEEQKLIIDHSVSIQGDSPARVKMNGVSGSRIFTIDGCDSVHISSIQLAHAQNGITVNKARNVQIEHVILNEMNNNGVELFGSTALLLNNTIVNNNGSGIYCSSGTVTAMNNIIVGNNFGIQSYKCTSNLAYNDVWNNLSDYAGADTGNGDISQNPNFKDMYFQEFSLKSNSPCIDRGNPDPQFNDPDGSRNDMGAIYFHPSSDTLPSTLAINVGGGHFVDSTGCVWFGDKPFADSFGYVGGQTYHLPDSLTSLFGSDSLFLTSRLGLKRYVCTLQNGYYQIALFFLEPTFQDSLCRIFSVCVNGDTVIKNLDIFQSAGYLHPLKRIVFAEIFSNQLTIDFLPEIAKPLLSGIKVKKIKGGFRDISLETRLGNVAGATSINWADFNHDFAPDVFVTCQQRTNILFKNNGFGLFQSFNSQANLHFRRGGRTSVFFDYNNDGWPDLFWVDNEGHLTAFRNWKGIFQDNTNSLELSFQKDIMLVHPIDYNKDGYVDLLLTTKSKLFLYENMKGKSFLNKSVLLTGNRVLNVTGLLVADFNNDGWDDFFLTNFDLFFPKDNYLFLNNEGQSFSTKTLGKNGVAADYSDYDNDGDFDLWVVSPQKSYSRFFKNTLSTWQDATDEVHIFNPDGGYSAVLCGDWNNDGREDLWLVSSKGKNEIFLNQLGGNFKDRADSLGVWEDMEGIIALSAVDLDADGYLDVSQLTAKGKCRIFKNSFEENNHWVGFYLVEKTGNCQALGAKIEIKGHNWHQWREKTLKNSRSSTADNAVHFGLGKTNCIDTLLINWPDGHRDRFYSITDLDKYYTIVENMPLEMQELAVKAIYNKGEKAVSVKWHIQTANSFEYFVLEKSYDTAHWETLLVFDSFDYQSKSRVSWLDKGCDLGRNKVYYRLKGIKLSGETIYSKIVYVKLWSPQKFHLFPNYPNPFNLTTQIVYCLNKKGRVHLSVFNCRGQQVICLVNKIQKPGMYTVKWNGYNQRKEKVSSGIYFIELKQKGHRQLIKTTLLK